MHEVEALPAAFPPPVLQYISIETIFPAVPNSQKSRERWTEAEKQQIGNIFRFFSLSFCSSSFKTRDSEEWRLGNALWNALEEVGEVEEPRAGHKKELR